jgi:hypothetical protein
MRNFLKEDHSYTDDLAGWAKVLINKLDAAGIDHVQVDVHGSGDSPQSEDVTFMSNAGEPLSDGAHAILQDKGKPYVDEIIAWLWEWSDSNHGGWYNNEGGYIEMKIFVHPTPHQVAIPRIEIELWEYHEPEAELTEHAEY